MRSNLQVKRAIYIHIHTQCLISPFAAGGATYTTSNAGKRQSIVWTFRIPKHCLLKKWWKNLDCILMSVVEPSNVNERRNCNGAETNENVDADSQVNNVHYVHVQYPEFHCTTRLIFWRLAVCTSQANFRSRSSKLHILQNVWLGRHACHSTGIEI